MRYAREIGRSAAHWPCVLAPALMVLAPAALGGQQPQAATRVVTSTFSVEPPEGKGWSAMVTPDSLGVQFAREKKGFLNIKTPELTVISVLTNTTTEENAARGEEIVAQDFFDQEEAQLRAGTKKSFKEDIVLKKADRRTDSVGVYRLYVFEPSIEVQNWQGKAQQDQQLCLYFPPDFDVRYQFFMFHITKTHPPKTMWDKKGFGELRAVIASFRDERHADSAAAYR
jgi:hypothetical protein